MPIKDLGNKGIRRKDQAFKGSETWWTDAKMFSKMYIHISFAVLAVQVTLTVLLSIVTSHRAWGILLSYIWDCIKELDFPVAVITLAGKIFIHNAWLFLVTSPAWLVYPVAVRYFKQRAAQQAEKQYEAGAKSVTEDDLIEQVKKSGKKTDLNLGNVPLPYALENEHAFVIGGPGKGKTVATNQIVSRLERRGAKAVLYDYKGDYVKHFYKPGRDKIINPLDIRGTGWNIFNELSHYTDIDTVAGSLIPQSISNQDPFWQDAARDVFAGILHYCYQNNKTSNKDIWDMLTADKQYIADCLKVTKGGERGYSYIQDASGKQALSVFATLMQYAKSFEYMATYDGPFCVQEWLTDGKPGFLFITNYSNISETLKPVLSLLIDLLGIRLLSLDDDLDRRIFFVIDEFGTLQRMPTIVKFMTQSRSKGGCVWIIIQDIGQVDKTYGKELRQAIFNAAGLNLFFSVNDPDTSSFISNAIGKWRYVDSEETRTMGSADEKDGITLMRRKITEELFMSGDIKKLAKLEAVLKLPDFEDVSFDYAKIKLRYTPMEDRGESFIMRPGFSLEEIKQQADEARADREAQDEGKEDKHIQEQKRLKDMLKQKKEQKSSEKDERGRDEDDDAQQIVMA